MTRDFNADDREFLNEIAPSLAKLRAAAGPCPAPELVMAASAGVLDDGSEVILQHLQSCPICQQLTSDLSDAEQPGVTEEEDRRIRARWEERAAPKRSWQAWIGSPIAIGALAAVVLVAVMLVAILRQEPKQPTASNNAPEIKSGPAPAAPVPAAKQRTAFVLTKAAIKVPATAVLTFRSGSEDAAAFLKEFASALEPYRSNNFAEAARRLAPLAQKYKESAAVQYYLGVSRLFLNENSGAMESFESARGLADDALKSDVAWYRAIALDRVGRVDDARRELGDLCSRSGDYQKQACASLEELK